MYKVYGTNSIYEALVNKRVLEVYLLEGYSNKKILQLIESSKISYHYVSRKKLDELVSGANHQGIVGVARPIKPIPLESLIKRNEKNSRGLLIMLDGLKDPHNLGAIIRSCDIFNGLGIIYKQKDSVSLSETVEKVSTGAINYVPLCEVTNLSKTINTLKDNGYWIVGLDGHATMTLDELPFDRKLVVIIGSEGEGISRLVQENCDYLAKIPMNGHSNINSLNASNACAIVLYEGFMYGKNNIRGS